MLALVEHPDVALDRLYRLALGRLAINAARGRGLRPPGRAGVKHVIAEMGGKNAIIVDDDADLDEAVMAVIASAFGYQGQKCSACSRVIVLPGVYDTFLERLVEASRSLKVGPGRRSGHQCRAGDRCRIGRAGRAKYIELGRASGREMLAVDVGPLADEGYLRRSAYFCRRARRRLAWRRKRFLDRCWPCCAPPIWTKRLRIANGTDYALTGGIFSRSPAHLERARREFLVGNLYLNRGITGAWWAGSRLADSRCRASAPKPAAGLSAAIRAAAHDHRKHAAAWVSPRRNTSPGGPLAR